MILTIRSVHIAITTTHIVKRNRGMFTPCHEPIRFAAGRCYVNYMSRIMEVLLK